MAKPKGRVILFPSLLAPGATDDVLPRRNLELLRQVRFFVVEELRSARRFLKHCHRDIDIDALSFEVLNEHTAAALEGHDIGVISEAGCPAVADPGADLVAAAQRAGVEVLPLVGPSSILLSLMASGFNGQSFVFRGYLPVEARARAAAFKEMERAIARNRQTQIFIETPQPPAAGGTHLIAAGDDASLCGRGHKRRTPEHKHTPAAMVESKSTGSGKTAGDIPPLQLTS